MTWEQLISSTLKESPYLAFPRDHREKIEARRRSKRYVYVRLAYQWKDERGNPRRAISRSLKEKVQSACKEVVAKRPGSSHRIDFGSLRGEAGTYLLQKIMVDIMSADLLFFDLTYRNPNVLFELGIAYTMGRRFFLLVKEERKDDVPSDLTGLIISPFRRSIEFCNSSTLRDVRAAIRDTIKRKMK